MKHGLVMYTASHHDFTRFAVATASPKPRKEEKALASKVSRFLAEVAFLGLIPTIVVILSLTTPVVVSTVVVASCTHSSQHAVHILLWMG